MERIRGRYRQFKEAVDKTRSGEWSAEEFQAFLMNTFELLTAKANECRTIIEEEEYEDDSPDEVREGLAGLDLYDAGMHEMYAYLEDGELEHLDEGLRLIYDGNEKINEAMRLNRETREDLDVAFMI